MTLPTFEQIYGTPNLDPEDDTLGVFAQDELNVISEATGYTKKESVTVDSSDTDMDDKDSASATDVTQNVDSNSDTD